MTFKFLVTATDLGRSGRRLLEAAGCEVDFLTEGSAAETEHLMGEHAYDAVISRTVSLTEAALRACPSLRVICKHGTGINNIDTAAASARGIPVLTTRGVNAQSVAEFTLALLFSTARQLSFFHREVMAGRWTRSGTGMELHGKSLGLIGFGDIGQRAARIAVACGMRVQFFDPAISKGTFSPEIHQSDSVETLLRTSQVISLHCPLTPATRGLLSADRLALLPERAIVINTARGELIDEDALLRALLDGGIMAAGLDTVTTEPLPPSHPLLHMANVIVTPHIAGTTRESLEAVSRSAVQQCLDYLMHGQLSLENCVNATALHGPQ